MSKFTCEICGMSMCQNNCTNVPNCCGHQMLPSIRAIWNNMKNRNSLRILTNNILKIESKVINFNVKTFADPQQSQYIALTIRILLFNV